MTRTQTEREANRKRSILALAFVAVGVCVLDAASKRWALSHLGSGDQWFGDGFRLTLIHNEHLAWGLSAGSFTPLVTSLATLILVALVTRVCRELAAVDRLAPMMLGLIGGAGLANGLDVFLGPSGVVDFIALPVGGQEAVLNVADVAAALGLVLCLRTVFVLSRAIAAERRAPELTLVGAQAEASFERVVPIALVESERTVPVFDERRVARNVDRPLSPRLTVLPREQEGERRP